MEGDGSCGFDATVFPQTQIRSVRGSPERPSPANHGIPNVALARGSPNLLQLATKTVINT
jgi:hypothetical protein